MAPLGNRTAPRKALGAAGQVTHDRLRNTPHARGMTPVDLSALSCLAFIVAGVTVQNNGGFPRAGANGRTDWPTMVIRETRETKRNETRRDETICCTVDRIRGWVRRGRRVGAMCKNAHCSPHSKLQSRMHTAPLTGGALPAHLAAYSASGPLGVLGNIVGAYYCAPAVGRLLT